MKPSRFIIGNVNAQFGFYFTEQDKIIHTVSAKIGEKVIVDSHSVSINAEQARIADNNVFVAFFMIFLLFIL